ncbi:acid phosphatase [Tatumella ptyseos ATCC 33301]|uniref:Acid phosphatase n=3 Tax=Erwiniaceae TaxID=1903409 RepID=A0A085JPG5_9GAMM|nr:acid phosphatase [Tatumella ptyseos ATCC 33301]SQK77471.1 Outer membrane protein P4 [Tatumella ptyseos]
MMKNKLKILPLILLPLVSFSSRSADVPSVCAPKTYEMALRYQQKSAEIMALQLQTYKFAQQTFQAKVARLADPEKAAVVMDLDETVLDNTPLMVRDIENCHDFTRWDTWDAWEKSGHPGLIPGAKAFLQAVNAKKVHIFYVSDRSQANKAQTLALLRSLGLPQVSEDNVMLDTASKQVRRATIRQHYSIIMLFGDSLPDLSAQFKNKKTTEQQRQLVAENEAHFADDWIVLPNAAYGSWTDATLTPWKQ